jgi:hypothetical protein
MNDKSKADVPTTDKLPTGKSRKVHKEHITNSIQLNTEYCTDGSRRVLNLYTCYAKKKETPLQVS